MTPYTILIPHFRTGKISAYCISQILRYKGDHDLKIIVVDNSNGEGTEYLAPFLNDITLIPYPKWKLQSHGIAYDFCLNNGYVTTEHFITLESDSYPTDPHWLDYYDELVEAGFDCAGSLLSLSGGIFVHPTGALYKRSIWQRCLDYVKTVDYSYLPNVAMKDDHPLHLMIRNDYVERFVTNPENFVELYKDYLTDKGDLSHPKKVPKPPEYFINKMDEYLPISQGVFHNAIGNSQEDIKTYHLRTIATEPSRILQDNQDHIITRAGFEPGQYLCYWMLANKFRIGQIPIEVKWLPGRFQQQQEYTLMENGVHHIWAVSAYHGCDVPELQDIVKHKADKMNKLYDSLPEHQKIHI